VDPKSRYRSTLLVRQAGSDGNPRPPGIPNLAPGHCAAILGKTGPETGLESRYRSTVPGM